MNDLGKMGHQKHYLRGNKMKTLAYVLIIGLVSISCLTGTASTKAEASAPDYWGEYCWLFQQSEDEHGPKVVESFLMRVGVTYIGGAYFTLQGYVTIPNDNPIISNGFAVIIGNEVHITMNTSQEHITTPYRDSGVAHASLSLSTLNGTWWSNYISFNAQTRDLANETAYSAGTMTFTGCP
jgi:hypothetical protein